MALLMGWVMPAWAEHTVLYLTDAQGNVLMTKDVQGNVIARYTYRPYGTQQSGPSNAGPSYTGHVNDPDTGLVYMQQRYYDPDGRFISPDSIAPTPGDIYNFNRYAYANNNPITNIDPDGRNCLRGDKTHCEPEPTPPPSPSSQPTPPPPPQDTATTLASVTVTATALPAAEPFAWGTLGEVGSGIAISPAAAAGAIVIVGYWPRTMGAAPCEMPGGPPCGIMMSGSYEPGYWPADAGASAWGRRHGVGAREGKGRFHGIKQKDKGRPRDKYGVNPDTGDVMNPDGEVVGNLNDVKSK